MSNPIAGEVIALRCVIVIRGTSNPFEVEVMSSIEDASGDMVPIPTDPDDGKVFCAPAKIVESMINPIAMAPTPIQPRKEISFFTCRDFPDKDRDFTLSF